MKIIRTFSMLLLALGFTTAATNPDAMAAGGPQDPGPAPMSSIAPPHIMPYKKTFTVREGDSLVIVVNATCPYEDEGNTAFDLQPSTPQFIRISTVYRSESQEKDYVAGLAVIHIDPQTGDAGKYDVSVMARACNGKVERMVNFKVKVRQARQNQ
jgi:hypothetical protein